MYSEIILGKPEKGEDMSVSGLVELKVGEKILDTLHIKVDEQADYMDISVETSLLPDNIKTILALFKGKTLTIAPTKGVEEQLTVEVKNFNDDDLNRARISARISFARD